VETRDNVLSIYRLHDVNDVDGLPASLDQLNPYAQVHVSKRPVPAVAGDLAGIVTDILLLPHVQALTTAAELGALLWGMIKCVKAAGKHLRLGKGIVRHLVAATAKKTLEADDTELASGIAWGPMDAELISGFDLKWGFDRDGEVPVAYFMAIAVPRPNERYYILSADGEIYASWSTQTFSDRLPEFLRPPKSSRG
jgi:hypothetical protein